MCYSQRGWKNNVTVIGLTLLWKATLYNNHIHGPFLRVINASWSVKTTFVFYSFIPVTPKQPASRWDISRMLFIVKHHQLSHLLNPNIFASGLQENRCTQVTLRTEMTHSTLWLEVACEKERWQLEPQSPVWAHRAGNFLFVTRAHLLWKLLNDGKL